MSGGESTTVSNEASMVPAELPGMRTDTPRFVRTMTGLVALPGMVLLWFLPKRFGAPLAAAGWRAAIVAHLVGVTIGLGLAALAYLTTLSVTFGPTFMSFTVDLTQGDMTFAESLRAPFAALVTILHAVSGNVRRPNLILLVVLGTPAALLLVAALLMPFAAAGERLRRLYGRCLRLTLWSTTMLILLGTGWLAWPRFMDLCGVEAVSHEGMVFGAAEAAPDARAEWARDAALALAVWWLVVLVRSGLHYAGPPDGPAWQARPPRCTKCGYIIASLALDGKCPECGYPVRESLARLEKMGLFTRWKAFRASVRAAFGRG